MRRSCSAMRSAADGGVLPVVRSTITSRPPRSITAKRLGGGRSGNAECFLVRQHRERRLCSPAALVPPRPVGARQPLILVLDGQYAVADRESGRSDARRAGKAGASPFNSRVSPYHSQTKTSIRDSGTANSVAQRPVLSHTN